MDGLSQRVVHRYRVATRPVFLDKREVGNFVSTVLVPDILEWIQRHKPTNEPLGSVNGITHGVTEVDIPGSNLSISVDVQVHSLAAKGKWAAVLRGAAGKAHFERGAYRSQVSLWINGALSPQEWLDPDPMKGGRFAPLHSCTHDRCLPFGLYSTLIHELTHAAESVFDHPAPTYYKQGPEKQEVTDETAYINDPLEVRAWMQQVVDDVVRAYRNPMLVNHFKDPHKLLAIALKMSTTWSLVVSKLTRLNQNKILKAVHDALSREGLLA